jgi:hypothetical protein
MLATLCHMATISPGMPAIEFCQEVVVDHSVDEPTKENINACYVAAQMTVAQRIQPGYTVHEVRCASDRDGKDKPKNSA